MPVTLFRIIWPFIRGYVTRKAAERTADYLRKRRERKRQPAAEVEESVVQEQAAACPPDSSRFSAVDAVWYTLSGVALGGALGFILTQIFRQED